MGSNKGAEHVNAHRERVVR